MTTETHDVPTIRELTNTGAIRLWESLGFTTIGVVPDAFRLPDDDPRPYADLHVMYLDLGVR